MLYDNCNILGPYLHSDNSGRKFVIIIYANRTRKTTSYARYLMECYLNRELEEWEEVDHKDENCSNDSLDNLQILTGKQNKQKTANTPMYEFICPVCEIEAEVEYRVYKRNQLKLGKKGPFCSKSCAAKGTNGGWK